jgi:hypothetical protein
MYAQVLRHSCATPAGSHALLAKQVARLLELQASILCTAGEERKTA